MDAQEKRRTDRRSVDVHVGLFHDGKSLSESRVTDLGLGGFALMTPVPLPEGEVLGLSIALEGVSVKGRARIRWREECGRETSYLHGLEFVELSFWDRQRLSRFINPARLNVFSILDLGLIGAAALVGLFALRDYWAAHAAAVDATWAVAPSCLVAGLLGWALSLRVRAGR